MAEKMATDLERLGSIKKTEYKSWGSKCCFCYFEKMRGNHTYLLKDPVKRKKEKAGPLREARIKCLVGEEVWAGGFAGTKPQSSSSFLCSQCSEGEDTGPSKAGRCAGSLEGEAEMEDSCAGVLAGVTWSVLWRVVRGS